MTVLFTCSVVSLMMDLIFSNRTSTTSHLEVQNTSYYTEHIFKHLRYHKSHQYPIRYAFERKITISRFRRNPNSNPFNPKFRARVRVAKHATKATRLQVTRTPNTINEPEILFLKSCLSVTGPGAVGFHDSEDVSLMNT